MAASKQTKKGGSRLNRFFEKFSSVVTRATGRPVTFIIAVAVIITWAITGPLFGYSNTWQLIINTGTTIITFLMVFIIQHSQNKDSRALQVKLDELIAASGSSNELIDVEELDEEELEALKEFYKNLRSNGNKKLVNAPAKAKIDKGKKNLKDQSQKKKAEI